MGSKFDEIVCSMSIAQARRVGAAFRAKTHEARQAAVDALNEEEDRLLMDLLEAWQADRDDESHQAAAPADGGAPQ